MNMPQSQAKLAFDLQLAIYPELHHWRTNPKFLGAFDINSLSQVGL